MKRSAPRSAGRMSALALALLLGLSSVTAVGYGALFNAAAAGGNVAADAPEGTALVSVDAAVTISACTNQRAGSENSYEMPSERWTKSLLVDGATGNGGWSCQPYDREMDHTKPVTVTLALAAVSEVSAVYLYPCGQFPADYEIQVSSDGSTYRTVASDKDVPINNTEVKRYTFDPVEATHVRLHITERNPAQSADGALAQLGELAVFGTARVSMQIPRPSIELYPGETDNLAPTFVGTSNPPAVTYASADPEVVSVAADGTVTARGVGATTVTLSCAHTGETAEVSVAVVDEKFDFDENILISIFWPPTPDFVTDEQYKLIADAGVNWVMGAGEETLANEATQKKMLALCGKYGLGQTVAGNGLGHELTSMTEEEIAASVARYRNIPGAYGFYILDEPLNPNVFLDAYVGLKKAAPEAYMHLNFLPSVAYGSEEVYRAQMNDWCRLTAEAGYPLDYLMFDRYPFPLAAGSMDRHGFFANLRSCYEVGLANDVKTGLYIQTVCQEVAFRRPTDAEIRYEMYASLAFGYKQLSFFTWFTPTNRSEPFRDGIIAADGTPNAHYETVKTINHEVLALGTTLVKCDALEVYFSGSDTYGQPAVPADFVAQTGKRESAILSLLRHRETGRNYLMVVNNDFSKAQTIHLTFDEAITSLSEVSRTDGSLKALAPDGQTLTLEMAAGDGILLALPEGFDVYEAPTGQPEASVNLAAGALVSAPYSAGTDGWYLSNLTDGARLSESGKNGWRSNDGKDTYLTLDLGRSLSFNRVDLYAAGSIFAYGATFPTSVKVSVSEDGTSFTPLGEAIPTALEGSAGLSLTLPETTARYLRLDMTAPRGTSNLALCEVEVYLDDGTLPAPESFDLVAGDETVITYKEGDNIALGKESFVSSTTPDAVYKQWGWSQEYLNDGKRDNGWTSNVGLNPTPDATEFAGVAFGDLFAVDRIILVDNGCFPEVYEVALSADGINWTVVHADDHARDSASGTVIEIKPESPVNARFVRVTGTKLRGGGADGYLLQLAEIEAYGHPVCDRSVLQSAMETYLSEGGSETARAYTAAVAALEETYLTQTQANDYARKLLAEIGAELPETQAPETQPDAPAETQPADSTPAETEAPTEAPAATQAPAETQPTGGEEAPAATTPAEEKKGCKSALPAALLPILLAGVAILGRRRRNGA